MARLTTERRNALPADEFALPASRAYPLDTANRARNALARVSQFGTASEQATVRRKVEQRYPGIDVRQAAQNWKEKRMRR
jgi:hypothetical protein